MTDHSPLGLGSQRAGATARIAVLLEKGREELRAGEYIRALESWRQALALRPTGEEREHLQDVVVRAALSQALLEERRGGAVVVLERAREIVSHPELDGALADALRVQAGATFSRSIGPPRDSKGGARDVGRNAPCPCGSGRKYKRCHGRTEEAASAPQDGDSSGDRLVEEWTRALADLERASRLGSREAAAEAQTVRKRIEEEEKPGRSLMRQAVAAADRKAWREAIERLRGALEAAGRDAPSEWRRSLAVCLTNGAAEKVSRTVESLNRQAGWQDKARSKFLDTIRCASKAEDEQAGFPTGVLTRTKKNCGRCGAGEARLVAFKLEPGDQLIKLPLCQTCLEGLPGGPPCAHCFRQVDARYFEVRLPGIQEPTLLCEECAEIARDCFGPNRALDPARETLESARRDLEEAKRHDRNNERITDDLTRVVDLLTQISSNESDIPISSHVMRLAGNYWNTIKEHWRRLRMRWKLRFHAPRL